MHFLIEYKDQITLIISLIAISLATLGGFMSINTYRRTEQWKRAEFLAKEMKEFFDNERVQIALTLIDWGSRYVQLLDDDAEKKGRVLVTRQMQVRALLPHTLKPLTSDSLVFCADGKHVDDELRRYSPAEAAIRDCYDSFLNGIETLSSYVKTDLISLDNLRPYIEYWIDDIHAPTKIEEDAAWSMALATYISVYRFKGVQWLFNEFDRSISPNSTSFKSFLSIMADKELAVKLNEAAQASVMCEN